MLSWQKILPTMHAIWVFGNPLSVPPRPFRRQWNYLEYMEFYKHSVDNFYCNWTGNTFIFHLLDLGYSQSDLTTINVNKKESFLKIIWNPNIDANTYTNSKDSHKLSSLPLIFWLSPSHVLAIFWDQPKLANHCP